ncbi:RelA/SpoT family protein [Rhabdothermincola salaria]|uniref:RelA/SpoT family protein n=1 Tax=Rhabdothermincola salaria TaxID=2903142 RepID=UPI001E2EF993|nr:bifunctional (p)ppGpp synthetase/guanosine-3',5'-bis(diphosphate) 3'-pyrophosphohydrolase [Rhabdothermincola salaria]MCD9622636.1 bifunctional (p)ppGpp synthetase/guanosine-3',5'-bis(diphosphate) 3'-pyrophosphohydrolase [Rhabdothermincola salaria]
MATVDRVLPWRRHSAPPIEELAPLISAFRTNHPKAPIGLITRAYEYGKDAHGEQTRKSGEPYITHPVAVAKICAEFGLDDVTLAAAILHDALEDTGATVEDLEAKFGPDVVRIVDGVTKLDRIKFDSKEAQQAATVRKMLVAMAKDLRVLIIKLADRLHNMRTIAAMPAWKQERTAQETLDIYAPLAHRLGMQELKQQLEDLSFASLHPKRYAEIDHMVATRTPERELYLMQVLEDVSGRLRELRITAEVTGRPKHMWSIYEKMVVKGRDFDDIFDLVGIRVVVETVKDCYAALGSIHATWKPVQGRFKDYIAMPKFNLYQSLHTTVIGPQGKPLEVQIRTLEMHQRAEFGVAAHWNYKDNNTSTADLTWLNRIVDWQSETSDPGEFMANLKTDLEQDEVFVFTPKGKVITLPKGATAVDFAYAIHTEVGHSCIGARVNGRLIPLDSELNSGDSVEIFTSKVPGAGPSRDWLKFVVTHRAANKIRGWYSKERRDDAIDAGTEDLIKAMRREGLPVQKIQASDALDEVADLLKYVDRQSMYAAIGEHHVSAASVAERVRRHLQDVDPTREEQLPVTVREPRKRRRNGASKSGVHVEGLDDVMVRLSRCCTPVPGDEIMGFVTRGRGVSVHRADCANAVSLAVGQRDRLIDVEWDDATNSVFVASLEVKALDRSKLLRDVSAALAEHHVNIVSCNTITGTDRISKMRFDFELGDPSHLDSVISAIKRIDGIYDASRVLPGKGD